MTTFFDKLKRGMEVESLPKDKEEMEQTLPPAQREEPLLPEGQDEQQEELVKKPSVVFSSSPVPAAVTDGKQEVTANKKIRRTKKKKKEEFKKIEVKKERKETEKPSFTIKGKEKKWFQPEGQLTIDVYQTDKEVVIQSAIAGIEPEDLDISIEDDMLTIRGEREKTFEKEERNYFYQECYWGQFSREIILPAEVDGSRAQASMEKGILTIRIPKIERKKKRKITVEE